MKICIIGGVAGGASAAARLRRLDEKSEIVVFERGSFVSFANCGLPYHISGTIKEREKLILKTPEDFKKNYNIDVQINCEVLSIDRKNKVLKIKDLKSSKTLEEKYDKLIYSTGAKPYIPEIKGVNENNLLTLRDIPDMDKIISHIKKNKVHSGVIIGGGFIGLEIAENFAELGINTHIVELANQVLTPFDPEMANILHRELITNRISLHLEDSITEICSDKREVYLKSGKTIDADIIICSIGVTPESKLAKDCGLELGNREGVVVNDKMQTNDPNIYAIGDVTEIKHFVDSSKTQIPLASPANKQARAAADTICDIASTYKQTQGTAIVKVFNLQAASTGFNQKYAVHKNIDHQALYLYPKNHASYYPDATQLALKVIYDKNSNQILGAQCISKNGADKRIDVIATAMRAGLKVQDLADLELSYAPPFGSAKDPVNMVGFMSLNIKNKLVTFITAKECKNLDNPFYLDVRSESECSKGMINGAINIPLFELRERLEELPMGNNIVINCASGVRSYNACRVLLQNGFNKVYNLSGGYTCYFNFCNPVDYL